MNQTYNNAITNFYNKLEDVWPRNDKWHMHTHNVIYDFVYQKVTGYDLSKNQLILNAGSGGATYDLPYEMYHLDITDTQIKQFPHWVVGSVDKLPFEDNTFDVCICVGTVINYCNPKKSIKELSRVLKPNGKLILEFENSHSIEFLFSKGFGKKVGIVTSKYFGQKHTYQVFSYEYIRYLLKKNHLKINEEKRFHILSSFLYRLIPIENIAYKACCFDNALQHTKLSKFSSNIMLELTKIDDTCL